MCAKARCHGCRCVHPHVNQQGAHGSLYACPLPDAHDRPHAQTVRLVMQALANLDPVAYVRFASVYKNFREARDFEDFVGQQFGVETVD